MRPSPQPRSYTTSPALTWASSSMRSTTSGGVATYGTSCAWEDAAAPRAIPRNSAGLRMTAALLGLARHLAERLQELLRRAVEVLEGAPAVQHLAHLVG